MGDIKNVKTMNSGIWESQFVSVFTLVVQTYFCSNLIII